MSDKPNGQGFQPRASLDATCPDRGCASQRDRFPSYLIEALEHANHYVNYRHRTFDELIAMQKELDDLTESITNKLMVNFKPETIEYLGIKK